MKNFLSLLFLSLSFIANAQTAITGYNIINQTPAATTNNSSGWNSSGSFRTTYNYSNRYGQRSSGTPVERKVIGFSVGAFSFTNVSHADSKPFDVVTVKRHPNVSGQLIHTFYEYTSAAPSSSGNNYFEASYESTLENVINSYVVNRGSDNIFANSGASTYANIERLDLIKTEAITVVAPDRQGFLVNERGGNDNFKVAAIKTINASNEVTSLGNLVQITTSQWGKVGPNMQTLVMSRNIASDAILRPKTSVASQTLSGVFISFQDLGLTEGMTVYGISLFPDDVTGSTNLLTLANAPTNTPESPSGGGGMDMMAGGGYFVETSVLPVINLRFRASVQEEVVQLRWSTDQEINNLRFEVQKAVSETKWITIGSMAAEKQDAGNKYSFTDRQPVNGKNTYRLKQINKDGSFTLSNILTATFKQKTPLSVYPNPAKEILKINYPQNLSNKKVLVTIFSVDGKVAAEFNNVPMLSVPALNIQNLKNGMYIICVGKDENEKSWQQFIVSK